MKPGEIRAVYSHVTIFGWARLQFEYDTFNKRKRSELGLINDALNDRAICNWAKVQDKKDALVFTSADAIALIERKGVLLRPVTCQQCAMELELALNEWMRREQEKINEDLEIQRVFLLASCGPEVAPPGHVPPEPCEFASFKCFEGEAYRCWPVDDVLTWVAVPVHDSECKETP